MSRYRLCPTAEQEGLLLKQCAHARFVYNLGNEQRLMWRRWQGPTPGFAEQSRQLTEVRETEAWLRAGAFCIQQQALRDLDQAWRNFFAGTHGRPGWRKERHHEGFRLTGRNFRIRQDNARWSSVLIPKTGWVKFRRSRDLPEEVKSCRVVRDRSGRWHVSLSAIPDEILGPQTGDVVGVDLGVVTGVTLSSSEQSSPRGLRVKEAERALRLQRQLARALPGSGRRSRLVVRYARMHAREADRRKDWIEKTTTELARRFDLIRIEDLNVKGMTRSVESGWNVRQKAGLNRRIMAVGWAEFATRLEQKAPGRVQKVDSRYTSQTCNACRHCAPENRKSQAVFLCVACGHRANADVNAACNIRDKEPAAGRAVAARGDSRLRGSVKREPRHRRPAA